MVRGIGFAFSLCEAVLIEDIVYGQDVKRRSASTIYPSTNQPPAKIIGACIDLPPLGNMNPRSSIITGYH